jgi:hypothetical protein
VSLHNEQNPIRKWMEHGRSNADPLLDDGDTESDTLIPSRIVMQCDDSRTLRRITDKISIVDWVDETARDTHISKRNKRPLQRRAKEKIRRECLEVMNPLLVRDAAHHTKNRTTTLMSPMMMVEGMELAGIVLHHLVVVRSSQVRSTNYVTYVYYNFPYITNSGPYFFMRDRLYSHHIGSGSWCTIIS